MKNRRMSLLLLGGIGATIVVESVIRLLGARGRDDAAASTTRTVGAASVRTVGENAPVNAYLSFVDAGARDAGASDATYIADGLRDLAGALGALDVASPGLNVDLRVAAEHVILDPSSTENAGIVRDHLISVADVLGKAFPAKSAELHERATALTAATPLPAQVEAMRGFFRSCADAMRAAAAGGER